MGETKYPSPGCRFIGCFIDCNHPFRVCRLLILFAEGQDSWGQNYRAAVSNTWEREGEEEFDWLGLRASLLAILLDTILKLFAHCSVILILPLSPGLSFLEAKRYVRFAFNTWQRGFPSEAKETKGAALSWAELGALQLYPQLVVFSQPLLLLIFDPPFLPLHIVTTAHNLTGKL